MKFFAKAVITGFGFALGRALYNRIAKYVGLEDKTDDKASSTDANDPNLRNQHS